jgi:hypothetical protein
MTSALASIAVTMHDIDMPAGASPQDFACDIVNSEGVKVAGWAGATVPVPPATIPVNVASLPSGNYTAKVYRRDINNQPIGAPATAAFVLDQTISVPATVTVTLS